LETIAGNTITLDLGGGQFAYYMHLEPGSVRVKVGDRVRRGQTLARVGCTGDAREPHLHFEVTNSSKPLSGEGVPYLIDRYRSKGSNGMLELHTHELRSSNIFRRTFTETGFGFHSRRTPSTRIIEWAWCS
jgi:murein DD-endopeptidase MepM/ murein hydrolase activator NlpD